MNTKDFRDHKSHQDEQNKINKAKQVKTNWSLRIFYLALISLMFGSTLVNILTPYTVQSLKKKENAKLQNLQEQYRIKPSQQIKMSQVSQVIVNKSASISLHNKTIQRISYGRPKTKIKLVKAVVYYKNQTQAAKFNLCGMTNGVTLLSKKSIQTAKTLLNQQHVHKWIFLLGSPDQASQENLRINLFSQFIKKQYFLDFDSSYEFLVNLIGNCSSIVYLQNTFIINSQNAKKIVNRAKEIRQKQVFGYVAYTESALINNQQKKLNELRVVDLSALHQKQINKHLYIFDARYLEVVTPLNFCYYAKYRIQEIIIMPILVLAQSSNKLIPLPGIFYSFDEVYIQFKQSALTQPLNNQGSNQALCFVSYPSIPDRISTDQLKSHLISIKQSIKSSKSKSSIVLVVYVPYNPQTKTNLIQAYNLIRQLKEPQLGLKIRLRIKQEKAVSSLAVYESVHTFCHNRSIVISSRHNILFDKDFISQVVERVNEKDHYYYSGDIKGIYILDKKKQQLRFSQEIFTSYFSLVSIFKSQLMKMINIWVLKRSQSQFYQSEASFVIPMLQMINISNIKPLTMKYKFPDARLASKNESQQLKFLQTIKKWNILNKNQLKPIPYNSLINENLRRGNQDRIPKIIHQVWLKDVQIPQQIKNIQKSININSGSYKYNLWTKLNITHYDFPLSYSLIARVFQYQWSYNKNLHNWAQKLLSYQLLYNFGGIYMDLNVELKKPLDEYLKYQILFTGYTGLQGYYDYPYRFDSQIMASKKHSYYMKLILTQIVNQNIIDLHKHDLQAAIGQVLRIVMLDHEIFTIVAFGFHLFGDKADYKCTSCQQRAHRYAILHIFQ